jgi:hypothetical protein
MTYINVRKNGAYGCFPNFTKSTEDNTLHYLHVNHDVMSTQSNILISRSMYMISAVDTLPLLVHQK